MTAAAALEPARGILIDSHLNRARRSGRDSDGAWFATGAPDEELNGVLRFAPTTAAVTRLREALGRDGGQWTVWSDEPRHDAVLADAGFVFVEEEPVMLARLEPSRRPADDVTLVTGEDEMRDWVRVWGGRNDAARVEELVAAFAPGLTREVVDYLLARDAVGPVACAAVAFCSGGAAIEHIVTREDARGRGHGTRITQRALTVAAARGATLAALTASLEGAGIYRRLGFAEVGAVRRFRDTVGE